MFGRATITLGIGPHTSLYYKKLYVSAASSMCGTKISAILAPTHVTDVKFDKVV